MLKQFFENVRKTRESLITEPARLQLDDDDIVTNRCGEKITWAESKRRLEHSRDQSWLYKRFGVRF